MRQDPLLVAARQQVLRSPSARISEALKINCRGRTQRRDARAAPETVLPNDAARGKRYGRPSTLACMRSVAPYPLLSRLESPADLRRLPLARLPALAAELRAFLTQTVARKRALRSRAWHRGAGRRRALRVRYA